MKSSHFHFSVLPTKQHSNTPHRTYDWDNHADSSFCWSSPGWRFRFQEFLTRMRMFPRICKKCGESDDVKQRSNVSAKARILSISRIGSATVTRIYKYKVSCCCFPCAFIPSVLITSMIQLLPGNNGRVLLACLRKRPWWHATSWDTDNEDLPAFIRDMYRNPLRYKDRRHRDVLLNHLQNNSCLVSKKGLYLSLQLYSGSNQEINLLDIIPRTYYLESGELVTEGQRSRNLMIVDCRNKRIALTPVVLVNLNDIIWIVIRLPEQTGALEYRLFADWRRF